MLQLIDISAQVMYEKQKSLNNLLTLINATVSHELRNPLNSIIAINEEKQRLYQQLKIIFHQNKKTMIKDASVILKELFYNLEIQQSSSDLIKYIVQDLLDYAQINSNSFRKNFQQFNIRKAVQEVIQIQKLKADTNKIKLYSVFKNFKEKDYIDSEEYSPLIIHD